MIRTSSLERARHSARWHRAAAALSVAALAITSAAWAQAAPQRKVSPGSLDAAALYHNYCSVCHGDAGDGQSRAKGSLNPPPRNFTQPNAAIELSRARMLHSVKEGRPGTAMVGWKTQLSEAQIEAVVDYVREYLMPAAISEGGSRGRLVYAKNCSVCHGDRGAGSAWASTNLKPAPRNFTTSQGQISRAQMLAAVSDGKPDTAMAGFASQLSTADREAVVDYIRAAFMQEGPKPSISGTNAHSPKDTRAAPSSALAVHDHGHAGHDQQGGHDHSSHMGADMSAAMPDGLKPVVARGKKFYEANCATCHGVKGDGKGPRAYFIRPVPRNFQSWEARSSLNRTEIFNATFQGRLGTEMPAWGKVLTRQEVADVSEYVFAAFIKPGIGKTASRP